METKTLKTAALTPEEFAADLAIFAKPYNSEVCAKIIDKALAIYDDTATAWMIHQLAILETENHLRFIDSFVECTTGDVDIDDKEEYLDRARNGFLSHAKSLRDTLYMFLIRDEEYDK